MLVNHEPPLLPSLPFSLTASSTDSEKGNSTIQVFLFLFSCSGNHGGSISLLQCSKLLCCDNCDNDTRFQFFAIAWNRKKPFAHLETECQVWVPVGQKGGVGITHVPLLVAAFSWGIGSRMEGHLRSNEGVRVAENGSTLHAVSVSFSLLQLFIIPLTGQILTDCTNRFLFLSKVHATCRLCTWNRTGDSDGCCIVQQLISSNLDYLPTDCKSRTSGQSNSSLLFTPPGEGLIYMFCF
ncbi:hypothetical protein EDB84DRAFT_1101554 [Lactarius hengduanensis]|nr:hypothetical protein EDB84DRAFT_1101554 [Lactarius hengduanensis]